MTKYSRRETQKSKNGDLRLFFSSVQLWHFGQKKLHAAGGRALEIDVGPVLCGVSEGWQLPRPHDHKSDFDPETVL